MRPWSMREHRRGLRLDDVTAGQEHFSGYFCRTFEDDRYYAVAGHNHASVVEVLGIDQFRRLGGKLDVSGDDVRKAQEWQHQNARRQARRAVKVVDVYRRLDAIKVDGGLSDWQGVAATPLMTDDYRQVHGIPYDAQFRITFDAAMLYLAYEVRGLGPLKNTGTQWDRLFKTGASVDLQMGIDPGANPDRRKPVAGDFRLLLTWMDREPVAVLYRPVAPGAAADETWEVVSPVWRLAFDQVKRLREVRMARSGGGNRYVVEAGVPLQTLGLKVEAHTRVKLDWGVLATDAEGTVVLSRTYWANQATAILSDAPSEAALHPDLWGYARFFDRTRHGLRAAEPKDLLDDEDDDIGGLELDED